MLWVIDASVAMRWFLRQERHAHSDAVLIRLIDQPERFAIPELFCFEVFSVLCRLHPRARQVFCEAVMPLVNGGLLRHPMTESLATQAEAFVRKGLTGYDACYAALARDLSGIWLTFDRQAHRAIESDGISHYLEPDLPHGWNADP